MVIGGERLAFSSILEIDRLPTLSLEEFPTGIKPGASAASVCTVTRKGLPSRDVEPRMRKNLSSGLGVGKMHSQPPSRTARGIAWPAERDCPRTDGTETTNVSRSQPPERKLQEPRTKFQNPFSSRTADWNLVLGIWFLAPGGTFACLACMPTFLQLGSRSQLHAP